MGSIIISGGRVVDPATGMDAIADVAVLDGKIVAIETGLGDAERTIDATDLVVAPGFIDLHAHGQSIPADRMQAFDGVTTTLDLEAGVLPVASWYWRQAAQGRVLNYGASTNWAFARIGAMTGSNEESSLEAFGRAMRDRRWVENVASETEVKGILDRLTQGLNEGGIGIGILNVYAPGAGVQELTAVCQLAAAHAVPTFTHVAYMSRVDPESAAEAYIRLIGYAGATGAHMHICHFNSSSKTDVERCAVLVAKAQAQGLPITLEAYPYGTGSTVLAAAFFSDPEFEARNGTGYDSVQRVTDGRRFRDRKNCWPRRPKNPRPSSCGTSWISRTTRTTAICLTCRSSIPAVPSRPMPCLGHCRTARSILGTLGHCRRTPHRIRGQRVASPASSVSGCASGKRYRCWKACANARWFRPRSWGRVRPPCAPRDGCSLAQTLMSWCLILKF